MKYTLFAALLVFTYSQTSAMALEENPEIKTLFEQAATDGTFVLYNTATQKLSGYNTARAEQRFYPASTFKIPNTLIGLAVAAVENVDEVLPYTGGPKPFIKAWARDMGLREAICMSNVPIYQELARRIGLERMRSNVALLKYGNQDIGSKIDTFWLEGPLKISAVEQVRFLAKLAGGQLPYPPAVQASVRNILLLEQGSNWKLFGKTGWARTPEEKVGWWVGWLEQDKVVYAFSLNMHMPDIADAEKRITLGKASLEILGLMMPVG